MYAAGPPAFARLRNYTKLVLHLRHSRQAGKYSCHQSLLRTIVCGDSGLCEEAKHSKAHNASASAFSEPWLIKWLVFRKTSSLICQILLEILRKSDPAANSGTAEYHFGTCTQSLFGCSSFPLACKTEVLAAFGNN